MKIYAAIYFFDALLHDIQSKVFAVIDLLEIETNAIIRYAYAKAILAPIYQNIRFPGLGMFYVGNAMKAIAYIVIFACLIILYKRVFPRNRY